ncbi:hypothetical protein Dsin_011588 [Dipteronia sinensis]|uniref:Uncharacterized protein n=1 Tax=Dipteronia sinensis TaxID=43782 RepID=A0AAE0AUM6_9ROSI|nr:hypothetical protein Dsin_011588 [Dipteronia sinensis]
MAGRVVVVFDFDKTILDCDSDNWVVDELGVNHLFTQLLPTLPWNSLMDRMMMELHSRGKTMEDIALCLKQAPFHPRIISAIKLAHSAGCDLKIVSDANVIFIETILKHHGLLDCFSEIITNPSLVDNEGSLRILPYHDFKSCSHKCNICPPNMCKGVVMEKIMMKSCESTKRFIYVGDGSADFCGGLKLVEGDILMARNKFPVWDLICSNPLSIKAHIHAWNDGEELGIGLLNLINTIFIQDNCSCEGPPADCKSQTTSLSHDSSFSNALPIIPH